ncbi:MAG: hypothetical protein KUG77_07735 [Nannocystaceae bacterium]|nr:hypothetical protein [Nannocystaceae bacterium]
MIDAADARARYASLRDRDRTIASMQSKQRMRPVFGHLLDDEARGALTQGLREQLTSVRKDATALALDLGRRALLETGVDEFSRIGASLRRLEEHLEEAPAQALDTCSDLLTYLDERAALWGSDSWSAAPPEG